MPTQDPRYLSTSQVAELLGISTVAVFKRIKSGRLKARKIGRGYAIDRKDVAEALPDYAGPRGLGEEALSLNEAAQLLGVTRMTVYNRVRNGLIRARRIGRRYVIAKKDLPAAAPQQPDHPALQHDYVSVIEYAEIIGSNRKTVLNHINQGRIKARKVGRHYVIAREDIPLAGLFVSPAANRPEDYLSVAEAAQRLGISRVAVFKKVKKGQLPAHRMGRSYAIPAGAVYAKNDT
ncbi:MAG: excisionase family DNA-binding protein [Candidatus Omnitrophica bacterium]|nr:excisionase family DNA-binding protein [Candidatus Omnitrophota bacterium]MCB9719603.1 excisionase family DNA-binding protein [Candidatus Omnitrophota bacterium]